MVARLQARPSWQHRILRLLCFALFRIRPLRRRRRLTRVCVPMQKGDSRLNGVVRRRDPRSQRTHCRRLQRILRTGVRARTNRSQVFIVSDRRRNVLC